MMLRTSSKTPESLEVSSRFLTFDAAVLLLPSGLAPAPMNMRGAPTEAQFKVKERDRSVVHPFVQERSSCGRDSGARRDVGTLRLNGRGSPKGSREVLGDVASELQHVDARNREDGLQLRIRL